MRSRLLALPTLAAVSALALAGCAAPADAGAGAADGLQVVATTTQVADFTRNIIGDAPGVSLDALIQANQSAHGYDPSVADLAALGEADVLVVNGMGLEEWLDDAIAASGFDGVTVDAHVDIVFGEAQDEHERAADEHDADEHDGHAEDGHEGHEHAEGNPHLWTSVANARSMVGTIAAGLEQADPAAAEDFAANAAAYDAQLAQLDDWIHANVDQVPASERLLVSNHDAFGYFTEAYGVTFVGSIMPSFDDNAEPSAADIDALVADIRASGVQGVFSETSINPKTADTIAREAGVTVYAGSDALYGDSLGPAGSEGASYIGSQLHNVRLILQSWGVTPSAVPAELAE